MKSEFVATVSHDLRSPLTLMRGYATMLEMVGDLNDQQQNYVKKIVTGVENMSRLVNTLLDLGRIEIGVGLQLESVSAYLDILERVTSALQMQATKRNQLQCRNSQRYAPDSRSRIRLLLHQAVYNLVENALKYTPEKGRVTVRAWKQRTVHLSSKWKILRYWHRSLMICRAYSRNSIAANSAKRVPSMVPGWDLPSSARLPKATAAKSGWN